MPEQKQKITKNQVLEIIKDSLFLSNDAKQKWYETIEILSEDQYKEVYDSFIKLQKQQNDFGLALIVKNKSEKQFLDLMKKLEIRYKDIIIKKEKAHKLNKQ